MEIWGYLIKNLYCLILMLLLFRILHKSSTYWGYSFEILRVFIQNIEGIHSKYWGYSFKILRVFIWNIEGIYSKYWGYSFKILRVSIRSIEGIYSKILLKSSENWNDKLKKQDDIFWRYCRNKRLNELFWEELEKENSNTTKEISS